MRKGLHRSRSRTRQIYRRDRKGVNAMPNETRCRCGHGENEHWSSKRCRMCLCVKFEPEAAPSGEPPAFSREAVMAHAEDFPPDPAAPVQAGPTNEELL